MFVYVTLRKFKDCIRNLRIDIVRRFNLHLVFQREIRIDDSSLDMCSTDIYRYSLHGMTSISIWF